MNSVDSNGNKLSKQQIEYFKNSKVVDANNNLKVMYHGSYEPKFDIFDKKYLGTSTNAKSAKLGFFFTDDRGLASQYARRSATGNLFEVYLNITKPIIKDFNGENVNADKELVNLINSALCSNNDGVIALNLKDGFTVNNQYIVFEPNQIKSIDNRKPTNHDNINEAVTEAFIKLSEDFNLGYGDYERPPYNDGALQRAIDNNTPKEDYYGSVNIDAFCKGYPACGFVIEDLDNAYDYDGGRSLREWKYYLNKAKFGELPTRVTIYRAVPKSVKDNKIHNGDWVAITYQYAQMHAEGRYTDGYKILRAETTTDKLWFDGNNICEFGLDDTPIRWK